MEGCRLPAIDAEMPLAGWPVAAGAWHSLGTSQLEVRDEYERLLYETGAFAALPVGWVNACFPQRIQAVIGALILDGPGRACQRASHALWAYSRSPVAPTKRKAAGSPATGTVMRHRAVLASLFRTLVILKNEEFPSVAIEAWTAVGEIRTPRLSQGGFVIKAPRPAAVRQAWRQRDADVYRRLAIDAGEDELAAIKATASTRLAQVGAFRALRNRAALALLVISGGRCWALSQLQRRDYHRNHRGPAPDYRCGPALMLRPGKTIEPDEVRPKSVPTELATCIDGYLACVDKLNALARKRGSGRVETPGPDSPLLVTSPSTLARWRDTGIRNFASGVPPDSMNRAMVPAIAREVGFGSHLNEDQRKWVGHTPQEYRRLAQQMAERAGAVWNEEHPETGGLANPPPALYSDSLLDHKPSVGAMRALYSDFHAEDLREVLAGRASEGLWELLVTDRGATKRVDVDSYRRVLRDRKVLRAEKEHAEIEIDDHLDDGEEKTTRPVCQTDTLVRLHGLTHRVRRLDDRLAECDRELSALRWERSRWKVIPDGKAASEPTVDLDALEREVDELAASRASAQPEQVRDWVTVPELTVLLGGARSTTTRMLAGRSKAIRSNDRLWDEGAIPVDTSQGINFRRVWIPGTRPEFWVAERRLVALRRILGQWPPGPGWNTEGEPGPRCSAGLELPPTVARACDVA